MKLEINLSSQWWDQPPKCRIYFNDILQWDGEIVKPIKKCFSLDEKDSCQGNIKIEMYGKTLDQTQVANEVITNDQLLKIDEITVNDIKLGVLVYLHGSYRPIYPEHLLNQNLPPVLEKVDTLGFNGTWELNFTLPFHIWFLENLP